MRYSALIAAFTFIILGAVGCGIGTGSGSEAPAAPAANKDGLSGKLTLTGSSTIAPLVMEIGKRFERKHPGVRIDVQTGGSSRGVADAQKGLADIGLASRELKDDEKSTLKGFAIARDGVCVILNKSNPVNALSDEQVVSIYTGKATNWQDVGGSDKPITVVNKAEGRSTLELFAHYYKLKNPDIKASVIIGDNEQGIKTVAGNPDAIGYVSIGSAEYAATHGVAVKLLPMKGVAASIVNVRSGAFPLARPLNLVTKGEPAGLAKAFIDYCRLPEHHDIVKEQYFVPIE
jgi:phosphate transport system substrate-binding protein